MLSIQNNIVLSVVSNIAIPKIVHQIAPSNKDKWHPFWFKCQESILTQFNDCEYRLWNDREDIDNLVYEFYPEFATLYKSFPFHIMRIDFARLCILHKFGGIYADMDYFVYKNFYEKLYKVCGFIENLTEEYTSAKYENSLMYSLAQNRFFYEVMRYVKACFIQHKNIFKPSDENWRSVKNDQLVNNTTGSGMLSMAIEHYTKFFDIHFLDCEKFNNRPASYDQTFYGKHVHSSIWGNEYSVNQPTHLLIKNGMMYNYFNNDLSTIDPPYEFMKMEEFNFYKDYTNGIYLKNNNLDEIKTFISKSHL